MFKYLKSLWSYAIGLTVLVGWLILVIGVSYGQNFEETKRDIMQEVYTDARYLPLIDIKQATIDLNTLKSSLDRIEDQVSMREERQDTINTRVGQLRIAIATILKDTSTTEKSVKETLQSIAILKKKVDNNTILLEQVSGDIEDTKDALTEYVQFIYRLRNQHYDAQDQLDIIRLLASSDSIAQSLSDEYLVQLLTQRIHFLLTSLNTKHATLDDLLITTRETVSSYKQQWVQLKQHMEYLSQQRETVYELMSYLKQESAVVSGDLNRISGSQSRLADSQNILEEIVAWQTIPNDSELYRIIQEDPRSIEKNYYTWPFVGEPEVIDRYDKKKHQAVTFDIEQSSTLYAPAPWIVHRLVWDSSIDLGWMVLLHKDWYATFLSPLSEVLVEEWSLVHRWQPIARSGGKPWTYWAWIDTTTPYLELTVTKSWKPIDPLTMLDISVFDEWLVIGNYQRDYIQDQSIRQVYVSSMDTMAGDTLQERARNFLATYARGAFANESIWYQWSQETGVNPILGMCIGFAETSFKNFKTPNNIWNVWNDDRWRTVTFDTPLAWVNALFNVFNNQYLWDYYLLKQLSRFGNDSWFIYASSPYNWQKNIMNCLTSIYGYPVTEDFPIRMPDGRTE